METITYKINKMQVKYKLPLNYLELIDCGGLQWLTVQFVSTREIDKHTQAVIIHTIYSTILPLRLQDTLEF